MQNWRRKGQSESKYNTAINVYVNTYLNYTVDIFRLALKYVWYSVLLYDKEYRYKQEAEKFEWGTYCQDQEISKLCANMKIQ